MNRILLFFVIAAIGLMIVQNILTYLQYKSFQKAMAQLSGQSNVLGVGLRKGGLSLTGGGIVILAWNREQDRIMACKRLSGTTLWNRFKDVTEYDGLSLNEVRAKGIAEDAQINAKRREKEPYSQLDADKHRKKGALIQAVEAIDKHLADEIEKQDRQKSDKDEQGYVRQIEEKKKQRQQALRKKD